MGKILNKCPICGNRVQLSILMQYTEDYLIKNNGELYKNYKRSGNYPMDAAFVACSSESCDFSTDCDGNYHDTHRNIHFYQEGGICMYEEKLFQKGGE